MARNKKIMPFAESVFSLLLPIIAHLDGVTLKAGEGMPDSGHDRPSTKDEGIRIWLDSWIRPLHRQLYGSTADKSQKGYLYTQYDRQDARMQELETRYGGTNDANGVIDVDAMVIDPQYARIEWAMTLANLKLEATREAYDGLCQVYTTIFSKDWVWTDLTNNTANVQAVNNANKERALANYEKMKAAREARARNAL